MGARPMTPKPPPGFQLVTSQPTPPPGFQLVPVDQPQKKQEPEPSWWQRNITGVRPKGEENTPSVYDVEDMRSASNFGSMLFGASDAQLSDQVKAQLGERFIRQEQDENGMPIVVFKDQSGQERRGYVNKPGLDSQDVLRGALGSLPYVATGAAGLAAGVGRGLLANAGIQGVAAAGTSAAGDVAQIPLGSEQGIEEGKALVAGGLSAAGPLVARGASNAYQFARNRLQDMPQALQDFGRGAVNRVGEIIRSDRLLPIDLPQRARQMGPDGMIADMGDNLREATGALARVPGQNKQIVTDAIARDRRSGAPGRIRQGVDDAMGQEGNQRAFVEQQRLARNQQAAPFYQQFHQTALPETGEIAATIDIIRRGVPGAFQQARRAAIQDGIDEQFLTRLVDDPMGPITGTQRTEQGARVWTGAELDYLKRAVDTAAGKARTEGDREGLRRLGGLARRLRTQVDGMISPDPNDITQSPWAQARAIAGEGLEAEDALEQGSNVFTSKRDPFETQAQLDDLSAFGRDVYLRGARDDVRRTMGRASSAYGTTGDAAARRQFQNDFNQENLRLIAGPRAAAQLGRTIDNETTFARTYDSVAGNSATSAREAAKKMIPGAQTMESNLASEAGKKGPAGLATEYAFRFVDALTNGALERRNEVLRTGMARLLTLRGPERDAAIAALNQLRAGRRVNADVARAIDRTINALSIGARGPAIGASQGSE